MMIPPRIQEEMCACCEWDLNKGGIKVFCFWPRGCVYKQPHIPTHMKNDKPYLILQEYLKREGHSLEHTKHQN